MPASASAGSPARCSAAPPPSVLGVGAHLALVAAAGLFVSAWALPALLGAGPRTAAPAAQRPSGEPTRRPTAVLVVLGAIAGCTAFGEGALTDWGALLLREQLAAPATVAAAGYAGFSLAMAGGRLAGGRLLLALGERRLLVGGAVLAAAGAVAAVTTSSLAVALAGFVLVGLGSGQRLPAGDRPRRPARWRAGHRAGHHRRLHGPARWPAGDRPARRVRRPARRDRLGSGLALVAAVLVLTVSGERVRMPRPRTLLDRAVATVGGRLQPVVSGFGHGTGVYVRDLQALLPDASGR